MRRKMRRPSGACAILQPRDLVRRHLRDVAAGESDPAFAGARIAENRHHQRRFAGAVGTDQRHDLALADLEVDAPERGDVAVIGLHSAHGEERRVQRIVPIASLGWRSASSYPDLTLCDLVLLDAEIGRDHLGVVAHLLRGAVGDLLAMVEHRRRGRKSPSPPTCRARSGGWRSRARSRMAWR